MEGKGTVTRITPEEFAEVSPAAVTLVDLREPDEVLVSGIPEALNMPFSAGFAQFETIPQDKPVVVFCRVGDWSEQVAEILADRGYDASTLVGGYQEYRKFIEGESATSAAAAATAAAAAVASPAAEAPAPTPVSAVASAAERPLFIDAKGLKCPGPIVKVADTLRELPEGARVSVEATEDAFFSDIRIWCERTRNRLDSLSFEDGIIRAGITKKASAPVAEASALPLEQNDKTFVVFSGDLDKTIAAFIMANGAAAMGRKVTMFFTFWGLNILRRPEKVRVGKTAIERMFGAMMPRGTKKLGLSRMNMCGAGSKMIRGIMKQKGISSLEELIESAKAHGVRLVACQMSMDIMGIHKEELIEGVELGGVSTFLGSGSSRI